MAVQKPTIINKTPATISKYIAGGKRSKTTKIAWHYTGVHDAKGINTINNWFNSINRGYKQNGRYVYASAHFVCDLDGSLYSYVPMHRIAYTTNSANSYSIGIECATTGTDDHYTDKEYVSMVKLGAWLAQYYGLDPRTDFIRHTDVVGRAYKLCPKYFVDHEDKWKQFKLDCYNYMKGKLTEANIRNCTNGKGNSIVTGATSTTTTTTTTTASAKETACNKIGYVNVPDSSLNVRKGPGTSYDKLGSLADGIKVEIKAVCDNGWCKIVYNGGYGYVNQSYLDGIKNASKKVIKNISDVSINVRDKADWNAKAITQLDPGVSLTYAEGPVDAANGTTKMYKTISGTYVTASKKYVKIFEINL